MLAVRKTETIMFDLQPLVSDKPFSGTIACLHVCLNTHGAMDETTPLGSFRKSSNDSTPQERGEMLHQLDAFKCVSDSAAISSEAQTAVPDRDGPELDHHFVL